MKLYIVLIKDLLVQRLMHASCVVSQLREVGMHVSNVVHAAPHHLYQETAVSKAVVS